MKNKVTEAKITDLHFDNKNANKHTQKGLRLVEKSLSKLGAGRSILIDKNNNIIAGNGVIETAGQIGLENIRIVETDGKEIVAVKRTDIDINSKKGRELAIIDNHSAKESIDLDFDVINDLVSEYDISLVEWEFFDNKGILAESFNYEKDKIDRGLPYPITIVITEDDYEKWCEMKSKLNVSNDRDAFFKIIGLKK